MLLLTSTADVIKVVTGSATAVDVHASYIDNNAGTITPGRLNTAISTATTTTVVAAPAASTFRNVKFLAVRNKDASASNFVTVQHFDGTTTLDIIKANLAAGEELHLVEGFAVTYLSSGAVKSSFDPNSVNFTGGTETGVFYTPAAGTTTKAPVTFVTGTNKTSPTGGEIEYDGIVPYFTPFTGERGTMVAEQYNLQQGTSLVSQTAAQKMFASPTNGALTLGGSRNYAFECQFDLSSMSATSGSFGWALGGTATFTSIRWWSTANKATLATAAAAQSTMNVTASNVTLATASTATVGWAMIWGFMRVNAGGTVIPQISLGIAAAALVGVNSYFRIWALGAGTTISQGNWS